MSNPISVFVGQPAAIIKNLKEYCDEAIAEMPFEDALSEDNQSDYWQVDLSDMFDAHEDDLTPQEQDLLALLSGNAAEESQDDELGINAALGASDISTRFSSLVGSKSTALAKKIFTESELWPTAKDLEAFLQEWFDALTKAVKEKTGLVWIVWV